MRMPPRAALHCLALVPCLLLAAAQAGARDLKPVQTFTGRMPLEVPPLLISPITSQAGLAQAFKACRVQEAVPSVDFKRRMVLATVNQGSEVAFSRLSLDNGNLKTNISVTPDMPAWRTCAFAVVERSGVRTVNGVAVPR